MRKRREGPSFLPWLYPTSIIQLGESMVTCSGAKRRPCGAFMGWWRRAGDGGRRLGRVGGTHVDDGYGLAMAHAWIRELRLGVLGREQGSLRGNELVVAQVP